MGCAHGKCWSRPQSPNGREINRCSVVEKNVTEISLEHSLVGREINHGSRRGKKFFTERSSELVCFPPYKFNLQYSVHTKRGYYPGNPYKENQDSFCIRKQIQGNQDIYFFGVFDGHGPYGSDCSTFVKDRLVEILENDSTLMNDPVKAYNSAFLTTNDELHSSDIDDTLSGTTAITILLIKDKIYVANVGDSRAVIAVKEGNKIVAKNLSHDQTPYRKDEYDRVKICGARVLTVKQIEGLKDQNIQTWGDEETDGSDPPRLWVKKGLYPGTAFTRSLGDSIAESIGAVAVPEVSIVQLTPDHLFFALASDGVFEFMPSQDVVSMAAEYSDPHDACSAIAEKSYKLWLEREKRTDDITIIIVHIKGLSNSGSVALERTSGSKIRPANTRKGNESPDSSDGYCSSRSDFSDIPYSPRLGSIYQSHTVVASSLTQRVPSNLWSR